MSTHSDLEIGPDATADEVAAMRVTIALEGRSCLFDNPITGMRERYRHGVLVGARFSKHDCVQWMEDSNPYDLGDTSN